MIRGRGLRDGGLRAPESFPPEVRNVLFPGALGHPADLDDLATPAK
ncbi:hypothetical protein N8513_01255 [bacterium]|nr:hypothetical protein [bacterium]MDA7537581.1 hypothetical protein [Akkermansiaceae bacterium]MDA8959806.1 hypothetical protein [Akkermansiaceae bacterium]MDB4265562.1 hypothetical protein [Akkermansiaceae bacterium]MDB4271464.1 hypothetical protein [Akkermansiaceae bacterium]